MHILRHLGLANTGPIKSDLILAGSTNTNETLLNQQISNPVDPPQKELRMDDPRFRITPVQQMVAACGGALITSFIVTPFDVVKIRLQAQQKDLKQKCFIYCNGLMDHLCPCANGNSSSNEWFRRNSHFTGTVDAFVKISQREGISSLWSGLSPTLVLALPATVVYFVTYEQLRIRLKDYVAKKSLKTNASTATSSQPPWIPLVSGATARLWAATAVSPLELIRTKMQSKNVTYKEMQGVLAGLLQSHGWRGLWRGLGPTLLRDVPFSGIYWVSYETFKSSTNSKSPSFLNSFLGGSISGTIAAIITTPFDVAKTYKQIDLMDNGPKYVSTVSILKSIYQSSGVRGLFMGLIPRVVKVAPACAIMVAFFEYGKNFFQNHNMNQYKLSRGLALEAESMD
nr:PREDICTED: solute carrier family 25 member 40-like isoform X1 [Bemisia tabaci]